MSTTLAFKDVIDLPDWRPLSPAPVSQATGGCICSDLRNSEDRLPFIYYFASSSAAYAYNYKNDGWKQLPSVANPAGFGSGVACVVAPSRGPRGVIAAGASTTSFTLSTALSTPMAANQLANRGDGLRGHKVRIIDTVAGKTEERYVIANTNSTTPVIVVDSPFSFTPATGAAYEFLSGRVYFIGSGTIVAGQWRYYEILTNVFTAASITNLPNITIDTAVVSLDELHVPATNLPGEGFLLGSGAGGVNGRALTATGSSATTLTGQAAGGDASVLINEYRNFQLRIVRDSVTPTSVGQRRKITSHTAGVSPVYTVPTWTVTPSTSAQYVVENANEILLFTGAAATVYTYAQDAIGAAAADSWSTATYSARGATIGGGVCVWQPFGMSLDVGKVARYSHIYSIRGANFSPIDVFDIAGSATGTWSTAVTYGGLAITFNNGTSVSYDPFTAYAYINNSAVATVFRFDCKNRVLEGWSNLRYAQTIVTGGHMATATFIDGSTKVALPTLLRHSNTDMLQTLAQR